MNFLIKISSNWSVHSISNHLLKRNEHPAKEWNRHFLKSCELMNVRFNTKRFDIRIRCGNSLRANRSARIVFELENSRTRRKIALTYTPAFPIRVLLSGKTNTSRSLPMLFAQMENHAEWGCIFRISRKINGKLFYMHLMDASNTKCCMIVCVKYFANRFPLMKLYLRLFCSFERFNSSQFN